MLRMKVAAVLLIIIFVGICIHALFPYALFPYALFPFTQVEHFTAAAAASPTRASECNCLPGYIPSAEDPVNYGGEIKMYTMAGAPSYFFKSNKTNKWYWIHTNTCDIPNVIYGSPNNSNYKKMSPAEFQQAMSNWGNFLTCDLVNKKVSTKKAYFCQNLSDPSLKRKCY